MDLTKIKLKHEVISIDFNSPKDFIYINNDFEIYRNQQQIKVKVDILNSSPVIKILSDDLFLLVSREFKNSTSSNCWVINNESAIQKSFFIDSPLRIISTSKYIIASYDEYSFDTNSRFGYAQIVVFDYEGNCIFEYSPNEKSILFLENISFLKKDENTVYFMPEMHEVIDDYECSFPIIEFSLIDFSSKILFFLFNKNNKVRNNCYPSSFITKNNNWYFFDQKLTNSHPKITESSIIYELNDKGEFSEKLKAPHFPILPQGINNNGFSYIPVLNDLSGILKEIHYIKI